LKLLRFNPWKNGRGEENIEKVIFEINRRLREIEKD